MKKLLLIFTFTILSCFAKAQSFKKYYNEFFDNILYNTNGVIVTGEYNSGTNFTTIDNNGQLTTGASIPVPYFNEFIKTSDNGYLFSSYDDNLVKTDANGIVEWSKNVTSSLILFEDDQNNFIAAKSFTNNNITKVDASGNIIWEKDYSYFVLGGIAKTSGGYMAAGGINGVMTIAKINYDGDTLSTKKFYVPNFTFLTDFIQTEDGGYLATCTTGVVYRFNNIGDTLWTKKIFNGNYSNIISTQNYFYVTENNKKISKVNLDDHNILWSKAILTIPNEEIHKIAVAPDGGVLAVCTTYVANKRTILIKLGADGKIYDNSIKGNVYKDLNGNCTADSGEPPLKGVLIEIQPGPTYAITDAIGKYEIDVDTGVSYTVTPLIENLKLMENICTASYPVSFINTTFGTAATGKDFGIHPIQCPDVTASFNAGFRMVRCIEQYHLIDCRNRGNVLAENVTVSLEVPSSYEIISSSVNYSRVDNKLTFLLNQLGAGEDTTITIKGKISCGTALNTYENFRTISTTTTVCQYPELSNDTIISSILVAGSFDPNDKQVFPSKINFDDYNNGKKEVRYLIRFQNTGNSEAINIKVSDTLSSMLDLSSIRNISTSHPSLLEIKNGIKPVLKWSFDDINLTYQSEDEVKSQGYISFTIDLKASLPDATVLPNKAYIYFDFNDPIITNDAEVKITSLEETQIYRAEVISSVVAVSEKKYLFTVTPNPVSERAEINMLPAVSEAQFSLFNSKGERVYTLELVEGKAVLESDKFSYGIYYFQIYNKDGTLGSGKILIK